MPAILERWATGILVLALTGCAALPVPMSSAPRHILPVELATYYDYALEPLVAHIEAVREKDGYRVKRLRLTSSTDSSFRPILIDWWQPNREGELPAILFSPILAGNDLYVREFAGFFAARGLHAVLVYRPKDLFSTERDLSGIETHLRESVIGLRRAIDWLEKEESVDPNRIGSFGISLGAILTSLLAAVEPRVKAHVLGLPAGDLPEILMTSQDKAIRKRRGNYIRERGLSEDETRERLKEVVVSEPLRFAPAVNPRKVLMIVGAFDRVLGIQRSLQLWKDMGRPRIILLPTGHYTAALATPYLKVATYSFLKRSLKST